MSQPSWIGQQLGGRYEIQELLGQGGMSAVYKAFDPNLRRVVAVKLIHAHLSSDPEFVRRFEEEAAAVASLRHTNIIQVFDFNHHGDTYFIVFEFVPGESLEARLKRLSTADRLMPIEETVKYAANIADALDYAHSRGMIHRDIKPANVMLNVHGEAILMDFGIVKIVGGDSHTATGAVLGTARYMSPEQVRGLRVDARTDIYAMGTMLFEMTGGRPPYQADSAMTLMMMHVNDPIPDVRAIRPDVPGDLVSIINKALAKDPNHRFQTAATLANTLRSVRLGGMPDVRTVIDARPATGPVPTLLEPAAEEPPSAEATYLEPTAEAPAPAAEASRPPRRATPQTAAPSPSPGAGRPRQSRTLVYGGIGAVILVVICVAAAAIVVGSGLLSGSDRETETPLAALNETAAAEETALQQSAQPTQVDQTPAPPEPSEAVAVEPTDEATLEPTEESAPTDAPLPTETSPPTNTPLPTETSPPTNTPPPTETPQPTVPPTPTATSSPRVQINSITLNGNVYVVDYSTFGYTPALPGTHIHFFFNTVPPQNAGAPGPGPWILYGGPNPFTGYSVGDKPAAATQMCSLVANADHSIQLSTGNCVDLPS